MKKLIFITMLLGVGCDNSTDTKTIVWICTTDYQFDSHIPEECESTDCPESRDISDYFDQQTIWNSLDECESSYPDSLGITTIDYPNGTGEYFSM